MGEEVEFATPAETVHGRLDFEAAVMDRVEAAVVVTDLEGRLLYANPCARRVYGWLDKPLVGTLVADIAEVDLPAERAAEIAEALSAGRSWEGEFTLTRDDRERMTVRATDSGLYDNSGRLVGVVSVVTDVTKQRESVDRLRREKEVLRFLLDASTVLAATRDYRDTMQQLAEVAVPMLADLCLIDTAVGGELVRMGAAHADPLLAPLVRELAERYAPDLDGEHPVVRVMRTGEAELSEVMTDEFLRATTKDERHLHIVREMQFSSYMCVPLKARGRVLGTITLVSAGSGRSFGAEDLALAEELARRAALVVDNARILSASTSVSRALQRALLPPSLPKIDGIELAARYRAAGEGTDVGGDLYDVFELGRGAWAAVVGDVSGTGPEAAAITGLVRHSLRASGFRTRDPASMLRTANQMLWEQLAGDPERFCTACCVVLRPKDGLRATVASAGHPPALVLRSDGDVEELPPQGGLLGVSAEITLKARRVSLSAGDRLVLYTDGLTEARAPSGDFFGEAAFEQALRQGREMRAEQLAQLLLDAVQAFTQGRQKDDLAVLIVGVAPAV